MDLETRKALLHSSLERVVDVLGDITAPVMALYYARHPEARALFTYHDRNNPARLEGTMVEQVLYCLMQWYDSPGEIEIILITTLPHHIETLGVSNALFCALLTAVCDTVVETIPQAECGERAVWRELHDTLVALSTEAASHARPRAVPIAA